MNKDISKELQEKLLLEQKKILEKIMNLLLGKIDVSMKIVRNYSCETLVLENPQKKSFHHIFFEEEKIILTKNFPDAKNGYTSTKKKSWDNFDELSNRIPRVCKILGYKKITT